MFNEKLSDHEMKALVRNDIIEDLRILKREENATNNRILTLPSLNFDVEIEALDLGFIVNTVEYKKSIFQQQLRLRSEMDETITKPNGKYRLWLKNQPLFEYLLEHPNIKYDLMYIDLCGQISKDLRRIIAEIEDRCNIVYITVLMLREPGNFSYLFTSGDKVKDYTEKVFNIHGFRVEKTYTYRNNKSNMCTFKLVRGLKGDKSNDGFVLYRKNQSRNEKPKEISFGSISPNIKKPRMLLGQSLISMGLDISKRYLLYYNPQTKQIALKQSESNEAFAIVKLLGGKSGTIYVKYFCINFGLKQDMKIIDAKFDNRLWILQLEER